MLQHYDKIIIFAFAKPWKEWKRDQNSKYKYNILQQVRYKH